MIHIVSDHILKIVIEAEDRATAALERIEALMKRLGLIGTESFNGASNSSKKFVNSVVQANSPLSQIQKHLKTVGTTGVQSFNQLSVSERKSLLELSSMSKETRDITQKLNEVGVTGRNTWNQLNISEQKALTSMNSLSQSTVKVMNNFSQFGMNATSATNALKQLKMDSTLNTNLEQAKIKVSSLGVDINSTKGKILTLGTAAKESISGGFSGAITSTKEKLGSLKASISNASNSMKTLNQSSRSAGSGMSFLRSAASMTVGMIGYDLVNSIMTASRESINARGNFTAFGKRLEMTSSELKKFSNECDNLQSTFKKVDMNAVGASALELGVKLDVPKSQISSLTKMVAVMSSAFVKEGRTQEDAILAVSDAMDGQFRRLQEIGINQDKLKQNGWNGNLQDTESLMNAINKTMDEMGFTETASGIYTLDDAYQALTVSGGRLIGDILIPITPLITGMIDGIIKFIDCLKNLPGEGKIALLGVAFGVLGYVIMTSVIPAIEAAAVTLLTELLPTFLALSVAGAPLWAIVAAITAIVLVVYEVGKAFGWWTDVSSMIDAISAGINRLWAAFSNNPDVQLVIQGISDAFNWLLDVLTPVGQWFMDIIGINEQAGAEFDIVRAIIDVLGASFHILVEALTAVYNAFMFVVGCVQNTISFFQWLYTTIVNLPNSVQAMITGFVTWLSQLPGLVWNYLVMVSTSIITAGANWITNAKNIAYRTVYGVINWISQLPRRVYNYIVSVASRILSAGANWISNARSLGVRTVNAVINQITGLPGKVYTEFMKIPERINSAVSGAVSSAANFGNNIKNAVLNALHIHSPGVIQEKIATEFANIPGRINDNSSDAYDSAKDYGSKIVDGFLSNDMSNLDIVPSMDNDDVSTPTLVTTTTATLDTSNVSGGMTDTSNIISSGFNNMLTSEQTSMSSLVSDVNTNLGLIKVQEQTSMDTMTAHIHTSMNSILSKTKSGLLQSTEITQTNLTKMQNSTTKSTKAMVKAWNGMKNSIVTAAKNIKTDSTKWFNSLGKNISSFYGKLQNPSRWGTGSASGAGPKTGASGGFRRVYRAPSIVNSRNSMRAMSSRLAESTRLEHKLPRTLTVKSVQNNPNFKDIIDFVRDGDDINVKTLFETGVLTPNNLKGLSKGNYGAWENTVTPNVNKIKKTARNWSMKGPKVANRVDSGITFHVKDFENTTPKIGLNDFINMAFNLVQTTRYGYYANSERYGNWLNALNHNTMNCSDGSDMLIALARTCGLPAEKVHCYWGTSSDGIAGTSKGEGHFVARIGGRIMDSVSMRHGSLTSPKVHGYGTGPTPKTSSFSSLTEAIKEIAKDSNTGENFDIYTGETVSSEVNVNGELKVIHEFINLPVNVSAEDVAKIVNETTSSDEWQKKLANSIAFQSEDNKVKTRLQRKLSRAKGVR